MPSVREMFRSVWCHSTAACFIRWPLVNSFETRTEQLRSVCCTKYTGTSTVLRECVSIDLRSLSRQLCFIWEDMVPHAFSVMYHAAMCPRYRTYWKPIFRSERQMACGPRSNVSMKICVRNFQRSIPYPFRYLAAKCRRWNARNVSRCLVSLRKQVFTRNWA